MIHEMKLQAKYFELIKSGEKTYEVRLNDSKRQYIAVGDVIIFKKEPECKEEINATVIGLLHYNSFEDMAKKIKPTEIGFANKKANEIVFAYHKFYSIEDEKKFGVLAIKIKL